jgi:hypothetical protein
MVIDLSRNSVGRVGVRGAKLFVSWCFGAGGFAVTPGYKAMRARTTSLQPSTPSEHQNILHIHN